MNMIPAVLVVTAFFSPWQKIAPHELLNPSPVLSSSTANYGEVFQKLVKSSPLPPECAVYENDKLVGYSLNCK